MLAMRGVAESDGNRGPVHLRDALTRGDEQTAGGILHHRANDAAIQLPWSRNSDRLQARCMEIVDAIDAARAPIPQPARAIRDRTADVARGQTVGRRQNPEGGAVIPRDPAVAKRDEQHMVPVFAEARRRVERLQAVRLRVPLKAARPTIPAREHLAARNQARDPDVAA